MITTKRPMLSALGATIIVGMLTSSGWALPQFQKEFLKRYKIDDKNKNQEFVKLVKKTKCNVCHFGKKKKNRNAYGEELSKLLDKKKDKKNVEKIQKSLEKVEKMHTKPKDKKSPTYGDLIKKGKLPALPPKEEKKDGEEKAS